MSASKSNVEKSKKPWTVIVGLLLILVVLPGISWFYLKGGVNWRKQAISELGNYGKIGAAYYVYPDGEKENRLKGKIVVVHMFGENPELTDANKKILDTGEKLYEQFGKNNPNFCMAMIAQGGSPEFITHKQTLPSADYATWVWNGALGGWSTILLNGYESYCHNTGATPVKEYYALSDTSGTIRRFYDAMDDKEVGRMVEQIAILLPPADK